MSALCLAVLRYVLRAGQICFSEAEDKEPVRVGVGPIKILQEVVIVGDPKRVQTGIPVLYIGGKRHAFDLGRNLVRRESVGSEHLNDVQEKDLADCVGRGSGSVQVGDVNRVLKINLEDLLDLGIAAIAEAFPVALIDQKFVLVEGNDITHSRACAEQVCIFVGLPTADIDGDDAQQFGCVAAFERVLDERGLHDPDQGLSVGR